MRNLAYLYRSTGHYGKALATYEQVAELDDASIIRVEMANCLVNLARPTEARTLLNKLMLTPQGRKAGASAFLMALLYDPATRPEEIRNFHEDHCSRWQVFDDKPSFPSRPERASQSIRVGYLTADFYGDHPVVQFLAPILNHHADPIFQIESRVYNARPRRDKTADRMDKLCTQIDVEQLSDAAIADRMRNDQLDIVIDLSGHTSGHRLKVIGHRPAPITACYIGYPSTTGYQAVDKLIGDETLFPSGSEYLYTEKIIRLKSWLSFSPPPDMPDPKPKQGSGPIIFGSLNHLPKLNDKVISTWARILREVPDSRLLMKCAAFAEIGTADAIRERFSQAGAPIDRLDLEEPQKFSEAMKAYHRMDIALDPFPYNGGTTTVHALSMGIPVITYSGDYFCGRMGASLLNAIDKSEWIAVDVDEYVANAKALAVQIKSGNFQHRDFLHQISGSRLFDTHNHAADLAQHYHNWAHTGVKCVV